ncbi:ABC transporter permease [Sporosarcina sp. 179-K 3D1 HS]|uniref:ABC transporter permease n=1 Tax=Sporosarcina sp. 179-K 3D1 HS TaxID=3232169 RepID=UPI0039A37E0C
MLKRLQLPKGIGFVLPLLLIIIVFFNIPLLYMLGLSLFSKSLTLEYYAEIIQNPVYIQVLANTFKIGLITAFFAIILGYPLSYWMTTLSQSKQIFAIALIVLPFFISILVRTYAWIVMLGKNGIVNSSLLKLGLIGSPIQFLYDEFGVYIGTLNILLPFIVLPLFASMLQFDNRLLLAARSLGAKPFTAFLKVYFPLTLPAVLSGGSLVFILTLGFFVTPAILGGGKVPMVATMLNTLINYYPDWEVAAGISTILLIVTLIFYFLFQKGGRNET